MPLLKGPGGWGPCPAHGGKRSGPTVIAPMRSWTQVVLTERRMSFLSFLTSVCAIVGGVFTVSGLIESTVHKARTILGKKVELGKAI